MADKAKDPEAPEAQESFFANDEGKNDSDVGLFASDEPEGEPSEPIVDVVTDDDLLDDEPEPAAPPVSTKKDDIEHAATTPLAPQNLDDPTQQLPDGQTAVHDTDELTRLRQQVADQQKREQDAIARQQLADETAAFATKLTAQGMDSEQVDQLSSVFQQGRQRELQTINAAEGMVTNDRAKVDLAHQLAEKHNLGIAGARELLIYESPVSMSKAAENAARLAAVEASVAEVKQDRVKPQSFDDTGTTGPTANSKVKLEERYAVGDALSDSEMAIIFPEAYGKA